MVNKIIQIAATNEQTLNDELTEQYNVPVLFALTDDGQVLQYDSEGMRWINLPPIPPANVTVNSNIGKGGPAYNPNSIFSAGGGSGAAGGGSSRHVAVLFAGAGGATTPINNYGASGGGTPDKTNIPVKYRQELVNAIERMLTQFKANSKALGTTDDDKKEHDGYLDGLSEAVYQIKKEFW